MFCIWVQLFKNEYKFSHIQVSNFVLYLKDNSRIMHIQTVLEGTLKTYEKNTCPDKVCA